MFGPHFRELAERAPKRNQTVDQRFGVRFGGICETTCQGGQRPEIPVQIVAFSIRNVPKRFRFVAHPLV